MLFQISKTDRMIEYFLQYVSNIDTFFEEKYKTKSKKEIKKVIDQEKDRLNKKLAKLHENTSS